VEVVVREVEEDGVRESPGKERESPGKERESPGKERES
jgi:hypothetical protein